MVPLSRPPPSTRPTNAQRFTPVLILTVIQGPDKGRVFELPDDEPQMVGRTSESLAMSDTTVSRRHAELTPDAGEWFIRDLGSQNGTWVNGERIAGTVRLTPGDQVRVGSTLLVFGRTGAKSDMSVKFVGPGILDTQVERRLASNEDSMILAEPEPRSAAIEHLQVIYRLTSLTSQAVDRDKLLAAVMELIFNEFKPDRGFIVFTDEPPTHENNNNSNQPTSSTTTKREKSQIELRPEVVRYSPRLTDKSERDIHVSRTIIQHVVRRGEGVLSSNAMSDPRFAAGESVHRFRIRSAICSPIAFRDRTFGAIYVDSSIANYTFTPEQLALMNAIGRHTGLALANAEAYAKRMHTERLAAIGQTVASLSHSIKNILQGLRGGADIVEMGLKKQDFAIARGGWDILRRNLDRIMDLTMNMLAYSRQRRVEPEITKVGPLIEEAVSLLHDAAERKGVACLVDVDPECPPVPLDAHLMHQALVNLIANAIEAVPARTGSVTVLAEYEHESQVFPGRPMLRISVIDNGPGIEPSRQTRIFEPFHTSKGLGGTGLGLAVTKRVATDHAGRIRVQSTPPNGAAFIIEIPADLTGASDPSATTEPRKASGDEYLLNY